MRIKFSLAQQQQQQQLPISQEKPSEDTQQVDNSKKPPIPPLDNVIFAASCLIVMLLLQLPMEDVNGKPVPIFLFHGHPSTFHAFVICLMGSAYGSVCSIYLRERRPKIARFYFLIGAVSISLSFLVFLWVAIPVGFMWLASKFR